MVTNNYSTSILIFPDHPYFVVSVLLILASQRIEDRLADWFDSEMLRRWFPENVTTKRGSYPSLVEWAILAWVIGACI